MLPRGARHALHEGAHGVTSVRKVQGTSRQGGVPNAKFRALAEESGLDVAKMLNRAGRTTVPDATAALYRRNRYVRPGTPTGTRRECRARRPGAATTTAAAPLRAWPPDPCGRVGAQRWADYLRPVRQRRP